MPEAELDCMQCGACCTNPARNRAEGYVDYVEVKRDDLLRRKPELMRRLVVFNARNEAHMKLDVSQRCVALRGAVGRRVSCFIYDYRPRACRRVEAGSRGCLEARRDAGIDP